MVAGIDVLMEVDGRSVEADVGGVDEVGVEPPGSVETQAAMANSVANATRTRNGGRVGPPNPDDERRGLN